MTDRELLELAAKAAGVTIKYNYLGGQDARCSWNPLTDDGDALRLAVKLKLQPFFGDSTVAFFLGELVIFERYESDSYAATRRAIVRAAAEIGRAMK